MKKNKINIKNNTFNLLSLYNIGSIEYQIIKLTEKINKLQQHFKKYHNDINNKRSLLKIISRRKKFLIYIKYKNFDIYNKLITDLKLRK